MVRKWIRKRALKVARWAITKSIDKINRDMAVIHISTDKEFRKALKSAGKGKTVVVDFYAEWCGPCKEMSPIFESLSKKFSGPTAVFLNVDVEDSETISTTYSVTSLPSFLFFKDGAEIDRIEGADRSRLESKLSELTGISSSTSDSTMDDISGMIKNIIGAASASPGKLSNVQKGFVPFAGQGQKLGDTSAKTEATPGTSSNGIGGWISSFFSNNDKPADSSNSDAGGSSSLNNVNPQSLMGIDDGLPTTQIKIKLIDSSRIKVHLNSSQPLSKIREFIIASRPDYASVPFTLCTAYPNRNDLTDETISIQDLKLENAVIFQSQKKTAMYFNM